MNDSQSSEIFSEDAEDAELTPMDLQNLISDTQTELRKDIGMEYTKSTFNSFFNNAFNNAVECIFQKLDLLSIPDPDVEKSTLRMHMKDIISLLQSLTNFLKNVIEVLSTSYDKIPTKTFPNRTGQLLNAIFHHCKDSEMLYGSKLRLVEPQLKHMFQWCHELQVHYWTILDKLYQFNLQNKEDLEIFLEVLDLNLTIGVIVQSLDLKTLAEQWKAYTAICEKYSNYLLDKSTFQSSSKVLCEMILANIETAENDRTEDQKIALRSLKLVSFLLKILVKFCQIFKHGVDKDYRVIMNMIEKIQMKCLSDTVTVKTTEYLKLYSLYVTSVVDNVVSELRCDDQFTQSFFKSLYEQRNNKANVFEHIVVLCCVMRSLVQKYDQITINKWVPPTMDNNLLAVLFEILPSYYPAFFNKTRLKVANSTTSCNVYEYLLIHVVALAGCMDRNQYCVLEQAMFRGIMGKNVCRATFASDLWVMVGRISNPQITTTQVIHLCNAYKKLQNHHSFANSPQQVYLQETIKNLFSILPREEKNNVFNTLELNDDNCDVWCALRIKSLPDNVQRQAEELVVGKLKTLTSKLMSGTMVNAEFFVLIKYMKLAATCSFVVSDGMEEQITNIWLKACLKHDNISLNQNLNVDSVWLLDYLNAAKLLTLALIRCFQRNGATLIKVLHVISSIITSSCVEIKLTLLNVVFKLALCDVEPSHRTAIDKHLTDIFKEMFNEPNMMFKCKLYEITRQSCRHNTIQEIVGQISSIGNWDHWHYFLENGNLRQGQLTVEEQYEICSDFEYQHKCLQSIVTSIGKSASGNFEFADIESIFSMETDTEPMNKKLKLETSEVESMIKGIEKNVESLSQMKGLENYRRRIIGLSEKLRSLT